MLAGMHYMLCSARCFVKNLIRMATMMETLFRFLYYPVSIQMILTLGSANELLNCDNNNEE